MLFIDIILLLGLCLLCRGLENDIEVMKLADFPNNAKIALHMPCVESNMFATKCMCHLKCTDENCQNAINLCNKYAKT